MLLSIRSYSHSRMRRKIVSQVGFRACVFRSSDVAVIHPTKSPTRPRALPLPFAESRPLVNQVVPEHARNRVVGACERSDRLVGATGSANENLTSDRRGQTCAQRRKTGELESVRTLTGFSFDSLCALVCQSRAITSGTQTHQGRRQVHVYIFVLYRPRST